MQLIVHQPAIYAGNAITGTVRIPADMTNRGIRIELTSVEIGRGRQRLEVVANVALEPNGSDTAEFSLPVPAHLGPGFTTEHGSRTWTVRAVLDRRTRKDPVAEAPIEILAPPSSLAFEQLAVAQHTDQLLKQAAKHRQMYWAGPLYGGVLPAVLLSICAVLFWLSGSDGSGKIAAYCLGATALLLLGTTWMALGITGRRLSGATILQVTPAARRGTVVEVNVDVTTDEPLILSFAMEEFTTIQTATTTVGTLGGDGAGQNGRYGTVKMSQLVSERLAEQSIPLTRGPNNLSFLIPPDAALTYPGLFYRIEHSIRIVKAKDVGNQSKRLRKLKRFVVVVA